MNKVIEKYELSSGDKIRKEDLTDEDRKEITRINTKVYTDLRELLKQFTADGETSEMLTDSAGMIYLIVSPGFDKESFTSLTDPFDHKYWGFS